MTFYPVSDILLFCYYDIMQFLHPKLLASVQARHRTFTAAARCAVKRNDEYLCTGGDYRMPIYSRVSKQAGAIRVHSTFRTCY